MLEFNEMMMKKFVLRPILQMPRLLPQHLLKERIIQISLKVLFWSSGSLWVSVSASRQHVDDQSSSWRWWLLNWWTLWRVSFLASGVSSSSFTSASLTFPLSPSAKYLLTVTTPGLDKFSAVASSPWWSRPIIDSIRVFSEPKWKSGQMKSRWNRSKIGTIYEENRSKSGQKTSQIMFYLSFYQANLYAPIFLQGSTLCVLDKNANSEHIRSTFPICSEFGALLRFSEQLKTLKGPIHSQK